MDKRPLLNPEDSDEEDVEHVKPFTQKILRPLGVSYTTNFKELSNLVKSGDLAQLKEALNHRDIQLTNSKGWTILHVAATYDNVDVLGLLLRHKRCVALLDRQDQIGTTPLIAAFQNRSMKAMDLLCGKGADPTKTIRRTGETVLHMAATSHDTQAVEILLKYNSSPEFINFMDYSGDTPLTEAVRVRSPVFYTLMNRGASVARRNTDNGRTILHVAVAYNRQSMLENILKHTDMTKEFVETKDIRGDSALMIAVKLQRFQIIKILTSHFDELNGINMMEHESVMHEAVESNRLDILQHLLHSTSGSSINFFNGELKTPLLYAAELDHAACLQALIECGADFHLTNPDTGHTLLHVVAKYKCNSSLPFLMNLPHISWFFLQKDNEGHTPYMTAIISGNYVFLHEALKVKDFNLMEYNNDGEPFTYYAIKQGFPKVLYALLLSPKYYSYAKKDQTVSLDYNNPSEILKAEIRGDIYATDVYILIKEFIQYPLEPWFPPSLLVKTLGGRSVFHACALGGSLECLQFLYDFYKLFAPNERLSDFNTRGILGNTPLLYAAQCGNVPVACVNFFVTHGADLAATNYQGVSVVQALYMHNPDASNMFASIFNNCITAKKEHYYSDRSNIKLDFSVFCPTDDSQTKVLDALFKETTGKEKKLTLHHPLVVAFLEQKINRIKILLYARFICSFLVSIIISILFPLFFIDGTRTRSDYGTFIVPSVLIITFIMTAMITLPKMSIVFSRQIWFTDALALIPPIAMIFILVTGSNSFFAPELVAAVILICWICVLVFMINLYTKFSHQVSVFFRLLHSISKQMIVLTVLIVAFSLSFFCLYNDDKRFAHFPSAFIYTFTVMMPGFISDLPTFSKEYFSTTPDPLHFTVECVVLLAFVVVVVTSFVNMIVGLAVRGGQFLEEDGAIFRSHHEIHYLTGVEYWIQNRFSLWLTNKCKSNFLKEAKCKLFIDKTMVIRFGEQKKSPYDKTLIRQFRSIIYQRIKAGKKSVYDDESNSSLDTSSLHDQFGYLPGAQQQFNY